MSCVPWKRILQSAEAGCCVDLQEVSEVLLVRVLKFAVSGALIAWLFSSVDFLGLREQLADSDWQWLVYANLLIPVAVTLGVWRWHVFLQVNRLTPGFGALTNFWLVGQFFSNFLPSNVGGDVVKASLVARHCGPENWPHAASSVFVGRVTGLFGMFLVLPLGVALNFDWVLSLHVQIPLLLAFAGLLVLSILVFSDFGNVLLRRCESVRFVGKVVSYIRLLHDSTLSYRAAPRSLFKALALSSALTLQSALQVWMLIQLFPDTDIAWTSQIVVFTLVSLVAMVPITINGYGLQEGIFTVLLVSLGLTPSQGIFVAIAYRLGSLLAGAVGGIMFALGGKPVREPARDGGEI